jgi:hypothetical protein
VKISRLAIAIFLVSLLLSTTACVGQKETPATPTTPTTGNYWTRLSDVPIHIGNMAFNESHNTGFSVYIVDTWSSDDLYITVNGELTGTFVTQYGGKQVKIPQANGTPTYPQLLEDALFVDVCAVHKWLPWGDTIKDELGMIPVLAQQSNDNGAVFTVAGNFKVPTIVVDTSMPLAHLEVNLTWARVYNADGILYFQILPGDVSRYYPDIPQTAFNTRLTQPLTGRFGHHSVLIHEQDLRRGGLLNDEFNYYDWIKQSLPGGWE